MEAAPSRTAMLAAVARGHLRLNETPPWVLETLVTARVT